MSLTLFGNVLTDGLELPRRRVVLRDGRIERIEENASSDGADLTADGWIVPGFIDLQVNGAEGLDLTSAPDPSSAVAAVAHALARHGTTAFCPTIVSVPESTILERLPAFAPCPHATGAESLGAHLEGPFINPAFRGVHEPSVLRPPSAEEWTHWQRAGAPALVTLAPELPDALALIAELRRAGVVVSLGHSGASLAQARQGLTAGATMGTHLFNAMPPFHHRQPGLIGALLGSDAFLGLIADGVHLDPLTVDLIVRLAGTNRVALVSDALAAAGAPPGPVSLGDQEVYSDGRAVRRADGTIAGSASLLDQCLRNLRDWLPWLPPAGVIRMATETPARVLGTPVARRKGRVAPGYDADLALLDREWRVTATIVRGELVS